MIGRNIPLFRALRSGWVRENIVQAVPFWIASLIAGLVSVAYTWLFGLSEWALSRCLHWHAALIFVIAPVSFILAWLLVVRYSPGARGSGIPQVMAIIDAQAPGDERSVSKLLGLRIILIKIGSSMLMVFGGGAVGREGPTIQVSASVFYLVHKWIPAGWSKLSRKSYYITGAAAGLAAAFNTPLGGVVFAIEELARIHVSFFRTALFSAVIIAGLTAQGFLGPYLYLGYPDVTRTDKYLFLAVLLVAALSGVLGAIMSWLILKVMNWKRHFGTVANVAALITIGLIVATVACYFDGNIVGSGKDIMTKVLFTPDKHVSLSTVVVRTIGPVLCFNSGAAGGIFAPSLSAGASLGGWMAQLFHFTNGDCNIIVLCGMVGFLTGVTRTPFTSAILVLEMTDRHSVVFYLLLAALVSGIAAMLIDEHSLYERLKNNYLMELNSDALPKTTAVSEKPGNGGPGEANS